MVILKNVTVTGTYSNPNPLIASKSGVKVTVCVPVGTESTKTEVVLTSAVYELENLSSQLRVSESYSFGLSAQVMGRALVTALSVRYGGKGLELLRELTSGSTRLSRRRDRVHRPRYNQLGRRQHNKVWSGYIQGVRNRRLQ